jgi:hypothetical protein
MGERLLCKQEVAGSIPAGSMGEVPVIGKTSVIEARADTPLEQFGNKQGTSISANLARIAWILAAETSWLCRVTETDAEDARDDVRTPCVGRMPKPALAAGRGSVPPRACARL